MKIVNARCSSCGAELTYDSDKAMLFCPYCGSKQIIIDGDEVKVAQAKYDAYREVELAREETEREKNRQEHEREKEKIDKGENVKIEKERIKAEAKAQRERLKHEKKIAQLDRKRYKRSILDDIPNNEKTLLVIMGLSVLLFCLSVIIGTSLSVNAPEASQKCKGKQYAIVLQQFKDAGFARVKCEAIEDLSDGWLFKDTDKIGTVKQVSVNGKLDFKKNDSFSKFDPVTIYYHDYPDQQDEN